MAMVFYHSKTSRLAGPERGIMNTIWSQRDKNKPETLGILGRHARSLMRKSLYPDTSS
jgi:hypothetical protein